MFDFFDIYRSGFKHYFFDYSSSSSRGKGHNKQAHKNNYKQKIKSKKGKR